MAETEGNPVFTDLDRAAGRLLEEVDASQESGFAASTWSDHD
jgi:hypothetical protein